MPVSISTPRSNIGRHVFGAAALAFGLITLAWHDYNGWHLPGYIVYPAASAEIFGGAAIQLRRTAKTGAAVLGAVYLVFAFACHHSGYDSISRKIRSKDAYQLLYRVFPAER